MLTSESLSSWQEEFRQAIKTSSELEQYLGKTISKVPYPVFIPKPFLEKIIASGEGSPLWKQFIPSIEENDPRGSRDPIGDELHSKGHGIIHRYFNRILFSPTEICPIICRYCFRKNELQNHNDVFQANLSKAIEYVVKNPEVEEVILTGGDPLVLSDQKLDHILTAFSKVPTIKMVRFHTRTPVILPSRITPRLIRVLTDHAQHFPLISLVIHTNHLSEWTPDFLASLQKLKRASLNLMSQSVLLKNINDNVEDLELLFKMLMIHGVRPYYLHHPDTVKGGQHFLLSLEEGRQIYGELKKRVSGFILPRYVIELPKGEGKALAYQSATEKGWLNHTGKLVPGPIQ